MLLRKSVLAAVAVATLTVSAAFATVPAQTNACNYQFPTNLRLGAVSQDVQNLQKLLNMDAATRVSVSGAGSAGFETFRFGPATLAAVKKFQAANGISPVSGYVGPLTRGVLNTICSSTVSTTPTTNTGSGVVSNSIPVSVLVQGQAGAKLGEFVVSGNGTVVNLTLMRTGLSNNSTLANVYLYDGVTRLTDANSVRTDGSIVFSAPSGLFQVNGSKTITVRADIASSNTSGQTVGVALTGVTMMGGQATPVTGANGPLFSISSASTASVSFTSQGVSANTSLTIPRTNYSIWNVGTNVSTNNVNLKGLTLDMVGSADMSAISNVTLYVDGVQSGVSSVMSVNGNKRVVFDLSSNPKMLQTGGHTIEVRADIVSGASRDFTMQLMSVSDIVLEDTTLPGVGVSVGASGYSSYKNAGKQTLTGASNTSVNIFKDTSYTTTNITPGASNVTLGKFKLTAYGEDTKVQTVVVGVSGSAQSQPGNVGLFVNGSQVGNTITTGGTTWTFNLGSNFIAMAGQETTVEVRGNALDWNSGASMASGTIITTISSASGIGQYSQSSFTNTSAPVGQTLTYGGGNYAVGNVLSGFNSAVSPNASNAKIGSFSVQAGTTEGADVRTFAISIGGTGNATYLSNVRLVDAATGNDIAPAQPGGTSMSFTPSASFIVPAGQTRTVNLMANVGNQTNGNTVIPTLTVTGYGVSSNQSLTFTGSPLTGTTVTYTTAVTGTPACSSKLNAQDVIGGSTLSNVCVLNFTSTNGASTINDLTFTTSGTAGAIESVTINNVTVSPIGTTVTFTGLNLNVPAGSNGVNFPVTVKYSSVYVGSGSGVATGATAGMTLSSMKATAEGQAPATTAPALSASNTMTLRSTLPSVVKGASAGSYGVNAAPSAALGVKVGSVVILADAKGDVVVGAIPLNIAAPGSITAETLKVGGTIAKDKNGVDVSCTAGSTGVCTFTNGYRITAGTSVTFDVFATVGATTAAGTLDNALGAAASFTWSDDVTTAGTALTGATLPSNKYQQ